MRRPILAGICSCIFAHILPAQFPFVAVDTLRLQDPPNVIERAMRTECLFEAGGMILYNPDGYNGHLFQKNAPHAYIAKAPFWMERGKHNHLGDGSNVLITHENIFSFGWGYTSVSDLSQPNPPIDMRLTPMLKRRYINSNQPIRATTAQAVGDGSYHVFLPTYPLHWAKQEFVLPADKRAKYEGYDWIMVFELKKGKRWRLRPLRSFGQVKENVALDSSRFYYNNARFTAWGDTLALNAMSSHWIMLYNTAGQLLDSIKAQGDSMPERFIHGMVGKDAARIKALMKRSGWYGVVFRVPHQRKLMRIYQAPDGGRQFLQMIDLDTHRTREYPWENGQYIIGEYDGKFLLNGRTIYRDGQMLFPLYALRIE